MRLLRFEMTMTAIATFICFFMIQDTRVHLMTALSANLVDKFHTFALAHPDIVAAYIFGSAATGCSRPGSDLDLAIMTLKEMPGFQRIAYETELSNVLGCDVDLVVFGQSGVLLQHQILKNGHLVYEADPAARVRQEVLARYEYLDTRFLYKELRNSAHG